MRLFWPPFKNLAGTQILLLGYLLAMRKSARQHLRMLLSPKQKKHALRLTASPGDQMETLLQSAKVAYSAIAKSRVLQRIQADFLKMVAVQSKSWLVKYSLCTH